MKNDLKIKLSTVTLLLLITASSCTGIITGCPSDPAFEGHWIGGGIDLRIGVVQMSDPICNLVSAVGFNSNIGAVWDRLNFSGPVKGTGVVEGRVDLWSGNNQEPVASFTLQLLRTENTITFDLNYTSDGVPQSESYELQKQP